MRNLPDDGAELVAEANQVRRERGKKFDEARNARLLVELGPGGDLADDRAAPVFEGEDAQSASTPDRGPVRGSP